MRSHVPQQPLQMTVHEAGATSTVGIVKKKHHPAHGELLYDAEGNAYKAMKGMRSLPDGSTIGGPGHVEPFNPEEAADDAS